MSSELPARERFVEILCEEWWINKRETLDSEEIYQRLVNEGVAK